MLRKKLLISIKKNIIYLLSHKRNVILLRLFIQLKFTQQTKKRI